MPQELSCAWQTTFLGSVKTMNMLRLKLALWVSIVLAGKCVLSFHSYKIINLDLLHTTPPPLAQLIIRLVLWNHESRNKHSYHEYSIVTVTGRQYDKVVRNSFLLVGSPYCKVKGKDKYKYNISILLECHWFCCSSPSSQVCFVFLSTHKPFYIFLVCFLNFY